LNLSKTKLVAFGLPSLATGMLERPALYILPFVYGKYFGMDLATIGTILFMARILDMVTDPLIGYLSDNTRSRWGRRKPWLIPGTILTMCSVYFLYSPAEGVSATYFALWYFAMYIGWTMLEIPMSSWMSDLAHDYEGRSRVVTFRVAFQQIGYLLFALIPLTPILLPWLGLLNSTEIDPDAMRIIALTIVVILPIGVFIACAIVPQGSYLESHSDRFSMIDVLKSIAGNKPARMFYLSFVLSAYGAGLLHAVYLFWVDGHLGIGDRVPWILVCISFSNVVGVYLWERVMLRIQRHKVWAIGGMLAALVILTLPLIPRGEEGFVWVIVSSCAFGLLVASTYIAPPAVMADIVDYDSLKSGHNRAGNYFSGYYLLQKLSLAIGGSTALWLLGWFSFKADSIEQSTSGVTGLMLTLSILPSILYFIAAGMMWFFPLNRHRQLVIQRRLQQRANHYANVEI